MIATGMQEDNFHTIFSERNPGGGSGPKKIEEEEGDAVGDRGGKGRNHDDRAGEFGVTPHLVGHNVGGGRCRRGGEEDTDAEIHTTQAKEPEETGGAKGDDDQLDRGGESGPPQIAAQALRGKAAADGKKGEGEGHIGGKVQAAGQQARHRQLQKTPD